MTAPLTLAFDVECSVEHAFTVWTARIGSWWPVDHTVTGRADVTVVLESGIGGRIYERTTDGVEHDWGEVTAWEPPRRVSYLWHIGVDRADATEVDIHFVARDGGTRVEVEHHGWDRLGSAGAERRKQNEVGWQALVAPYRDAIRRKETADGDRFQRRPVAAHDRAGHLGVHHVPRRGG